MDFWQALKPSLKAGYHHLAANFGQHRWSGRQPRLWILMYHRILPASDPRFAHEEPGMVVTPETFEQQLQGLRDFFELMPLSVWHQRNINGQSLPSKACAITFDDGWRDNYEYALPILRATSTPATLFAVADMIGTTRRFWPNRIATLLTQHRQQLLGCPQATWLTRAISAEEAPGDLRERLSETIANCKALSDHEIQLRLDELEERLGIQSREGAADLMTWEQLDAMAASGLVEIGSHTCTHLRLLTDVPADTMQREVVSSRMLLESKLQRPVDQFCYPNGNCSALALKLVKENYALAVTTEHGINQQETGAHRLLRIGMHEDASSTRLQFLARLAGW